MNAVPTDELYRKLEVIISKSNLQAKSIDIMGCARKEREEGSRLFIIEEKVTFKIQDD
jgi:hypothetical protein